MHVVLVVEEVVVCVCVWMMMMETDIEIRGGLTDPLRPGMERLRRLKPSSLASDPGTDRSSSERLWSVQRRWRRQTFT